jgi:hypothetical protein
MGAVELETANQFWTVFEAAAKTGEREAVYPFLAAHVEWVAPARTLQGINQVKEDMIWGFPPEHLDLEFNVGDWADLADGRVARDVHEVFRMKKMA